MTNKKAKCNRIWLFLLLCHRQIVLIVEHERTVEVCLHVLVDEDDVSVGQDIASVKGYLLDGKNNLSTAAALILGISAASADHLTSFVGESKYVICRIRSPCSTTALTSVRGRIQICPIVV